MTKNPNQWDEHHGRLAALIELSQAAGKRTLDFFGDANLSVDRKGDSSPVTEADRSAEKLLREQVSQAFPEDGVLGEEYDDTTGNSGYQWIVDPIDGTKSFICGVPLYSTLVGLEHEGKMVAGAIQIPAMSESVVAAAGLGAWHRAAGAAAWERAQVSSRSELSQCVFVTSQVDSFAARDAHGAYEALQSAASITRSWGDAYGYLLVATGRADMMVDPIVSPWDVGAILPVIEEAGGKFSTWKGEVTIRGGDAFGTNGRIHTEVLEILAKFNVC